MRRSILATAAIAGVVCSLALTALRPSAHAHCEVPCGIYDDAARVSQMLEDVGTVEKATAQISQLAGGHSAQAVNQAMRWVMTKEEHATRIQHTISQYFMTQRVKPSQENYLEKLAEHHAVLLAAMKAKQTVNMNNVAALRASVEALAKYYVADAGHDHAAPPELGALAGIIQVEQVEPNENHSASDSGTGPASDHGHAHGG